MDSVPQPVADLQNIIESLPGVSECFAIPVQIDEIGEADLSLPGEFGDLPQVAIMRTEGGLTNEVVVQVEIKFEKSTEAWHSLEFLAWWVRDWARNDLMIQMRPVGLPPMAPHIQLGGTLRFMIEFFLIDESENFETSLEVVHNMAESIAESFKDYQEAFDNPVDYVSEEILADIVDEPTDIEELKNMAESGDAESQFHLAFAYVEAEQVDEDLEQAFYWFGKASENDIPIAHFFLGRCHANGEGTEQNWDLALKHYRLAADKDVAFAMHAIGAMYSEGTGVESDLEECIRWYQKGVELDDPACKAELGDCYETGHGVEMDLERALELYEEAVAQGFDPVEEARDRVLEAIQSAK